MQPVDSDVTGRVSVSSSVEKSTSRGLAKTHHLTIHRLFLMLQHATVTITSNLNEANIPPPKKK